MNKLDILQSQNVEIVPSSVIQKLYTAALNTTNATLSGNLLVTNSYRKPVEYLMNRFENLTINVTGDYFVDFEDDAMTAAVASILGSGGNVTEAQLLLANASENHNISSWQYSMYNTDGLWGTIWNNTSILYMNFLPFSHLQDWSLRRDLYDEISHPNLVHINLGPAIAVGAKASRTGENTAYTGSVFYNYTNFPNLIDIIYPNVLYISGASCLYNINAKYIYFPKVRFVGQYLLRNIPNLELIYFGTDVTHVPSNFSDVDNSNYHNPCSLVINATTPPMIWSSVSVSNYDASMSYENYWNNAVFTEAAEGNIDTGNSYRWGFIEVYVPDDSLETYKTTVPWTKLASVNKIHPISELSSDYKAKILAATGDEL